MEETKQVIIIEVDRSCMMAKVSLNEECIMEGNFWDFHPGCHGITKYGNFKGFVELSTKIYQSLMLGNRTDLLEIKTVFKTYDSIKEHSK